MSLPVFERAAQAISRRGLLRRGQTVLVAVSGGVDSMALLRALHRLAPENAWRLVIAHLNHGLRGRSADADERLVVRTAKKMGLRVITGRAEVKRFATKRKLSIEMAARELRHDFLARTARRCRIRTIALAHHADDQVELFFLRLLRGSGSGLAGMKWKNPSPADPRIELIRPLLELPKDALRQFARAEKIPFREDASNASRDIERNRIRHELLPLLQRKFQPALYQTIVRVMDLAEADADFITHFAEGWLAGKNPAPFGQLPVAIQRRAVQLQLWREGLEARYAIVEGLRSATAGNPVMLSPAVSVYLDARGRLQRAKRKSTVENSSSLTIGLNSAAGKMVFDGRELRWKIERKKSSRPPPRRAGREMFDADKVGSQIILRHWRPGDRFQPIGMNASVKLQDLFTNMKIPRERRHELIVATTAGGELFWVEKMRISERFKLLPATARRLHWRWRER